MKKLIILLMIPILMQGQTVTEKIKSKFKQIEKAKQERLKECEEYRRIDSLNKLLDRYPLTDNLMTDDSNKIKAWQGTFNEPIYAMRKPDWKVEFITLWDEYAKECYADSTVYLSEHYIENNRLISKYHYTHKQPDLIGFIEFLRNKLKEN